MSFDPAKIEAKIDHAVTAGIAIDDDGFGLDMKTLSDAMEFAKVMALSKQAIPAFMRNEPGLCMSIVTRSLRWRLDPFFVAEQAYLTVNPRSKEEKIAFMSQLFNAIINKAEPLILAGKLRVRYTGEGMDYKAIIYGTPRGEVEPIEYETPTLGQRIKKIGRNDGGFLKGSPLYDDDPSQALWYYGSRAFIRRYFPHVLAGAYSNEDMQEAGFVNMRDVTPRDQTTADQPQVSGLIERLKSNRRATAGGFNADTVAAEAAKAHGKHHHEGEALSDATTLETKRHGTEQDDTSAEAGATAGRQHSEVRDGERSSDAVGSRGPDVDATGDSVEGSNDATASGPAGDVTTPAAEVIPPEAAGSRPRGGRRTTR